MKIRNPFALSKTVRQQRAAIAFADRQVEASAKAYTALEIRRGAEAKGFREVIAQAERDRANAEAMLAHEVAARRSEARETEVAF